MHYTRFALLTVYKTLRDIPTSTETKSGLLKFSLDFLSTVSSASSSICGFTVRNTMSQLHMTLLLSNVGQAPKSCQNPCVLSVRLETQTLSGFNIPIVRKKYIIQSFCESVSLNLLISYRQVCLPLRIKPAPIALAIFPPPINPTLMFFKYCSIVS